MIYSLFPENSPEKAFCEAGLFEEIDKWKRANQDSGIKKYHNDMLTDEEYSEQLNNYNIMKVTEDYSEYKQAFYRLCHFCHVVPRGLVVTKLEFKKGKNNKNTIHMEYSYNTKRIQLPEDIVLYHISKTPGITQLEPAFKGKSERGYLYEKPRVYFTIKRKMPKAMADYGHNVKMHMYMCKNKFKNVFVDPLLWGYVSGAVYVETNKPIPVQEIDPKTAEILKSKNDNLNEEAFDFDHFFGFITEHGLLLAEE